MDCGDTVPLHLILNSEVQCAVLYLLTEKKVCYVDKLKFYPWFYEVDSLQNDTVVYDRQPSWPGMEPSHSWSMTLSVLSSYHWAKTAADWVCEWGRLLAGITMSNIRMSNILVAKCSLQQLLMQVKPQSSKNKNLLTVFECYCLLLHIWLFIWLR